MLMARYLPAAPAGRRRGVARALALRVLRVRAVLLLGLAVAAAFLSCARPRRSSPRRSRRWHWSRSCWRRLPRSPSDVALGLHEVRLWSFRYAIRNAALVIAALALHPLFGLNGAVAAVAIGAAAMLAVFVPGLVRELSGAAAPGDDPARSPALRPPSGDRRRPGAGRVPGACHSSGAGERRGPRGGPRCAGHERRQRGDAGRRRAVHGTPSGIRRHGRRRHRTRPRPSCVRSPGASSCPCSPWTLAVALLAEPVLELLVGARFGDLGPALAPAAAMVPLASASALGVQAAALRLRPEVRLDVHRRGSDRVRGSRRRTRAHARGAGRGVRGAGGRARNSSHRRRTSPGTPSRRACWLSPWAPRRRCSPWA